MSSSTIGERKRVARMLVLINTQIQASLLVVFSTNVTLGVLIGITFALLGVDDAAAWGVAATVLHFVPYLGSVAL
ncbi:AI-2E family transporter, partial [Acinetobacter baumannii]